MLTSQEVHMAVAYSSFVTPAGNLAPAIHGANFDAPFNCSATFTGTCSAGEYRQYVMGQNTANGSAVALVLCGAVVLLPAAYQEDGCPSGSCTAYGHRTCPQHPYDRYDPARADGCQFSMYDAPGFKNVVRGTKYVVYFSFQGKLIDTSAGGAVLATKGWTIEGTTTVAETPPTPALVGLSATEKLIGAHTALNLDTGALELHILITRPAGLPGLDGSSMNLSLIDQVGKRSHPSDAPAVHEIGTQSQSTVSIVYTLRQGTTPPSSIELAIHGGVVTMRVRQR
jgi:hypothetical protein